MSLVFAAVHYHYFAVRKKPTAFNRNINDLRLLKQMIESARFCENIARMRALITTSARSYRRWEGVPCIFKNFSSDLCNANLTSHPCRGWGSSPDVTECLLVSALKALVTKRWSLDRNASSVTAW